jgi:sulfopyruvate decarboxylase, alpha subunit
MNEFIVVNALKSAGVEYVASLPCDRNKALTKILPEHFRTIGLTREEDGVGICAGIHLTGGKAAMSIQSSGLGNMMNALMSLTVVYGMPLPIIASWRGMEGESIEAQIPFNKHIPEMLEAFGISYQIFSSSDDLESLPEMIEKAFEKNIVSVALIKPECWDTKDAEQHHVKRARCVEFEHTAHIAEPIMTRLEAISAIMGCVDDDTIIVSNIGVPSKEVFASKDRTLNFYMMGSYTQATPIGMGMALNADRKVIVIDGDGSLLGSSVFPVISSEDPDLTVICLDNGTFGSTGDQVTDAYSLVNMGAVAKAFGISNVYEVSDHKGITEAISKDQKGVKFVHVMIRPGNSRSADIPMVAGAIKERFMNAFSRLET